MLKSKKGQEMSVNVVVGIILGMLMLFAGLVLFSQIMKNQNELSDQIDEETKNKIIQALDSGDPIYVPFTNIETKKKFAHFWVGIKNIENDNKDFNVTITLLDSENPLANFNQNDIVYLNEYSVPAKDNVMFNVVVNMEGVTSEVSLLVKVQIKNPETGLYVPYQSPKIVRIKP